MIDTDFRVGPKRSDQRQLLSRFASLGFNCELGLVQRHCDCESLGLFRFGMTPLKGLTDALDHDFHGLSDIENIEVVEGAFSEWITTHRLYGFEFHTGMRTDKFDKQEVLKKVSAHFKFLTRAIIEDLAVGEKLFVHRPKMAGDPIENSIGLSKSIRRYGNANLLWISLTEDASMVGLAQWYDEGIMVGFIDRFTKPRFAVHLSFEGWLAVCRSAASLIDHTH